MNAKTTFFLRYLSLVSIVVLNLTLIFCLSCAENFLAGGVVSGRGGWEHVKNENCLKCPETHFNFRNCLIASICTDALVRR